jgi:hypothetical protein
LSLLPNSRLLSESLALAEAHAKEIGLDPVMDPEFAADLEEIIGNRKPRDSSSGATKVQGCFTVSSENAWKSPRLNV